MLKEIDPNLPAFGKGIYNQPCFTGMFQRLQQLENRLQRHQDPDQDEQPTEKPVYNHQATGELNQLFAQNGSSSEPKDNGEPSTSDVTKTPAGPPKLVLPRYQVKNSLVPPARASPQQFQPTNPPKPTIPGTDGKIRMDRIAEQRQKSLQQQDPRVLPLANFDNVHWNDPARVVEAQDRIKAKTHDVLDIDLVARAKLAQALRDQRDKSGQVLKSFESPIDPDFVNPLLPPKALRTHATEGTSDPCRENSLQKQRDLRAARKARLSGAPTKDQGAL